MDSHDSTKHYVNGVEAFLHTLLAEFKDAEKRFYEINIGITKLVTPEVSCIPLGYSVSCQGSSPSQQATEISFANT